MYKAQIKAFTFFTSVVLSLQTLHAQPQTDKPQPGQPWSMEQCINYAWSHNLQIKQAEITQHIAKNNLIQSKASVLPSLSGFVGNTYNYGLTVNPFTNTFANNEVTDDNFVLSGSVTIFSGLQNLNTIRQNKLTYDANTLDLQSNKNTIALNIAQDYLQVLLNKELLAEATEQKSVTSQQVERTRNMVDAGSLSKSNLLDVESQEANDEVNRVNAQTQLDLSVLALAQQLDLDSAQMLTIISPEIDIPSTSVPDDPGLVYAKALTTQPDVESAQLKWKVLCGALPYQKVPYCLPYLSPAA